MDISTSKFARVRAGVSALGKPISKVTGSSGQRISTAGQRKAYAISLVISDAIMVGLALMGAWYIRIGGNVLPYEGSTEQGTYFYATVIAVFVYLVIFALNDLYDHNLLLGGSQEYQAVFRACSYGMVAVVFITFVQRTAPLSRGWMLMSWALSIALIGTTRFLWRRVFFWLRAAHGWLITPTLIVGADQHGRAIARQFTAQNGGVEVVGFVDDFLPLGSQVIDGLHVLGTPNQIRSLTTELGIEQIILVSNAVTWETFQELLRGTGQENGYEIQISPGFYDIMTTSIRVTHKSFVPLLQLKRTRIAGLDQVLKRALDLGLGVILLLLSAPLMLFIALAILITNGPPVLERHEVLGLKGDSFRTSKFYTGEMEATRRRLGMQMTKPIEPDPHMSSRVSRLLYLVGFDKLPQLFDVLQGRMSLVGPRTVATDLEVMHSNWLPNLLTVKPGWTGAWAVSGAQIMDGEMRLALYYIRNWTIWLDLQILFQTAKLAVKHWSQMLQRAG